MKRNIKMKIIATLLLMIILFSNIVDIFPLVTSLAVNENNLGDTKNIVSIGTVDYHLKSYTYGIEPFIVTHIAGYYQGNQFYPAYCMQRNRDGAGAEGLPSYDVTVSSIIGNDEIYSKVWRVAVNGYPYTDLGLSDWTYAYQATKMAMYCVTGQAHIDEFFAVDPIGESIIEAIKKLTYIGEYGTDTYKTPLAQINEQDSMTLDGNYYIQNYNLSTNLDIADYTIAKSSFPNGTIVTDVYGNEKQTFNQGEIFQIRIPKLEFEKQDINGRIRATVRNKSYAVFYGYSYDKNRQDYVLTGDPISLNSCSKTLDIQNNNAEIIVYKYNEDGSSPIAGVEFELLNEKEIVLRNEVTDEKGAIKFTNLYPGVYYVREKNTQKGYLLNNEKIKIILEYNDSVEKVIVNTEPTGIISIEKRDAQTGNVPQGDASFKGAVYDVYAGEDIYNVAKTEKYYSKGELVATREIDEHRHCTDITGLPLGTYLVQESVAPIGYLLDEKIYEVKLTYKDQHTKIITGSVISNEAVKKMKLHIFKSGIKVNGGQVPGVEGVEFNIKLYSDVQNALNAGYLYEEVWGGIDEYGNTVAVDNNRVAAAQTIAPTYEVIVTDEHGDAYTQNALPYGTYIGKETKTPKDFETSPDFTFSITDDESEITDIAKKVKNIVINNEQLETYIKFIKKDKITGKRVTFNNATFQIKAIKDIKDRGNGTIIYKKDEIITQKIGSTVYDSFTTNADNVVVPNGSYTNDNDSKATVITPLLLPVGEYEVTEIKTPIGFLQLETPIKFIVDNIKEYDKDNEGDYIKEIVINNEQPTGTLIIDKSIELRGNVDTSLVDISDLSGIEFRLTAKENIIDMADGSVIYAKNEEIKQFNLDKKGKYTITDLPIGTYELEEIKTLDGLVLNTEKYEVKFTQEDLVTKVYTVTKEISNDTTLVEFSKTDITGQEELVGTKLTVLDEKGEVIDNWTSTKEPHKIEGLVAGKKYILREDFAPDGYVKATDIEFTVTLDKETQQVIMVDKVLDVTKTDIVNGEEVEGAELIVTDKEGNVIDEWTSTKEPHHVSGLEEGKTYILTEKTAPYGYEVAENIEFTVSTDKETQLVDMKDMPILKDIRVVKLDSDTNEIIKDKFKFGIYEDPECTVLIKELESDIEMGYVEFDDLRYGIFYIKETQAPSGYLLSERVVKVEINDKGVFADDKELEEKDGVYSFDFYDTLIPNIQTGTEVDNILLLSLIIISIIGITFGIIFLKRKR